MIAKDATNLVREMDALWPPKESNAHPDTYPSYLRAMSNDLLAAFEGVAQATVDDLRAMLSVLRRRAAQSQDPMEQRRRPTAWELRAEWDRTRRAVPAEGVACSSCGGGGRKHQVAAWWKVDQVVATPLVVRCDCPAGGRLQRVDGSELLGSVSEWMRNLGVVRDGAALLHVFDVSPVYANVVAWALRDLVAGEIPDDTMITNVLRAVQDAKEDHA